MSIFGLENLETLAAMHTLAMTYHIQGRNANAAQI